jgi:hypothetical protein
MKTMSKILLFMAVLMGVLPCGSAQAVEGVVSYWRFDEGTGTMAYDSIGDNHGTIYGATWTSGMIGGALSFDGIDDYVAGSDAGFPIAQDGMTFTVWTKPTIVDGNLRIFFEYGTASWGSLFSFGQYLSKWYVDSYGDNNRFGTPVAGQWSFITITTAGTTALVYVDGVYVGSFSLALSTVLNNYYIGGRGAGYSYGGLADELAIWNRILSASEIQELYEQGLDPKTVAIGKIEHAIAEKLEALERIDAAIEKEWAAIDALDELLASGELGDLNKADILRTKQNIFAAIQQQEPSKNMLEQSLQKLEDSLRLLGYEL